MQPSSKREGFVTVPDITWDDVGALENVREELSIAILVSRGRCHKRRGAINGRIVVHKSGFSVVYPAEVFPNGSCRGVVYALNRLVFWLQCCHRLL